MSVGEPLCLPIEFQALTYCSSCVKFTKHFDGSAASMKDSTEDVLHCGEPAIVRFPYEIKEIAQERSLDYPPREREYEHDSEGNPILPFEYQEHCSLGNALHLKGHDTHSFGPSAKFNALKLDNGLELTYGEINGLAGDFFGTEQPISDGGNVEEQKRRFYEAYKTLAEWVLKDTKAHELLEVLQTEAKAVDEAIRKGEDPSTADAKLWPLITNAKFTIITTLRSGPGYVKLASLNVDHFGLDARTAYNAGHLRALEEAARGEIANLRRAYTMNAFADHFLQDSFASGHLRTPRRKLAGIWSLQAKVNYLSCLILAIGR